MRLLSYLSPGIPASLFEALAAEAGLDLALETGRSGPDPAEDPFRDGSVDIGWMCSTAYARLARHAQPSVVLAGVAWVPADPAAGGRPEYHADVVVPTGSTAADIADLAGCRIGGNDEISLSGHHALRIELRRIGHEPDRFADVVLTGGHRRSIDLLLAGELDAAVVDSVVLAAWTRAQPAAPEALRVIRRLGPWPTQPLVARASLPPGERRAIASRILAAGRTERVAAELAACAIAALVPVGPDHCDPVLAALHRG